MVLFQFRDTSENNGRLFFVLVFFVIGQLVAGLSSLHIGNWSRAPRTSALAASVMAVGGFDVRLLLFLFTFPGSEK